MNEKEKLELYYTAYTDQVKALRKLAEEQRQQATKRIDPNIPSGSIYPYVRAAIESDKEADQLELKAQKTKRLLDMMEFQHKEFSPMRGMSFIRDSAQ